MQGLLADNASDLMGFCFDNVMVNGDRLAVFGPAPDEHTELILQREGLLYVDCGRHYDWTPRIDALDMVLADGAKAVIYASPNYPTGTIFPLRKVEEVVEKYPEVVLIFDSRFGSTFDLNSAGPQTVIIGRTGKIRGPKLFAYGFPIQQMTADIPSSVLMTTDLDVVSEVCTYPSKQSIADEIRNLGFRVEQDAPGFLFIQKLGSSAEETARELKGFGYSPTFQAIHTWRGGVCVTLEEGP